MDYLKLIVLYICVTLIRGISICVFWKWFRDWGYGLSMRQIVICIIAGIKGMLGLLLAILLAVQNVSEQFKIRVLFHMVGCTILSKFINPLLCFLLCRQRQVSKVFISILDFLLEQSQTYLKTLKQNNHLSQTNLQTVSIMCMKDLYEYKARTEQNYKKLAENDKQTQAYLLNKQKFNLEKGRERYLIAIKQIYWNAFDRGLCRSDTLRLLIQSTDWDLDTKQQPINSWEYLATQLEPNRYLRCHKLLSLPILGKTYFDTYLQSHLANVHDICTTYVSSMEQCLEMSQLMMMGQETMSIIKKEIKQNKELAREYLWREMVGMKEVEQSLQVRKIASEVLDIQKNIIQDHINHGQLDDKESLQLKSLFQSLMKHLQNLYPSINLSPPPLSKILPFSILSIQDQINLQQNSINCLYQKGQFIFNEKQKARNLAYVYRGECVEYRGDIGYWRVVKEGEIIGAANLLKNTLRCQCSAYASSLCCTIQIPLSIISKLLQYPSFSKSIYQFYIQFLFITNSIPYQLQFQYKVVKMSRSEFQQIVEEHYLIKNDQIKKDWQKDEDQLVEQMVVLKRKKNEKKDSFEKKISQCKINKFLLTP